MDKTKLLDRVSKSEEERILLAHILDKLEQTQRRNIPVFADFLSPQEQAQAAELLRLSGEGTAWTLWGGYEGAERKMLAFLPDWLAPEDAQFPIRCLRAVFREEDGLTHRDFLGSLMGLGIVREKVGDLLVGRESGDLIVADSVADFLLQNWQSAGRARLTLQPLEPENLHIPEVRKESIRDTVATLRLDAVASSGFRMARGKASELIESGKVQVNWRECVKSDKLLSEGDTITARGFGKLVLTQVGGMTRKGRITILLERYL